MAKSDLYEDGRNLLVSEIATISYHAQKALLAVNTPELAPAAPNRPKDVPALTVEWLGVVCEWPGGAH